MGLAERFKDKLENKNIFQKGDIEESLEQNDIKFISKPIEKEIVIQPKAIHSGQIAPIENLSDLNVSNTSTKFEDLETELINKIRKTPYWLEFTTEQKKNMIEKYFEKRIQSEMYSSISYSNSDPRISPRNNSSTTKGMEQARILLYPK